MKEDFRSFKTAPALNKPAQASGFSILAFRDAT
jgi:hypothetical protein